MDIDAYLTRIDAVRPSDLSATALTGLHRAHVRSVPFENYDIHTGAPISLDLDDVYAKIVPRGRGGYCYELNGLFATLLRRLGFPVVIMSAFELGADGARGPQFEHMRLRVETSDGWFLADVGNGARWPEPVPASVGEHGEVRVERDGDLWWSTERQHDGTWQRGWAWTPAPREIADFTARNEFQQHDPESHFVATRMAVLPTARGRVSVVNGVFTEITDGEKVAYEVDPAEELGLLAERFGILVGTPWRALPASSHGAGR